MINLVGAVFAVVALVVVAVAMKDMMGMVVAEPGRAAVGKAHILLAHTEAVLVLEMLQEYMSLLDKAYLGVIEGAVMPFLERSLEGKELQEKFPLTVYQARINTFSRKG